MNVARYVVQPGACGHTKMHENERMQDSTRNQFHQEFLVWQNNLRRRVQPQLTIPAEVPVLPAHSRCTSY